MGLIVGIVLVLILHFREGIIKFFEEEDYARIKEKLTVSENSYLKLLSFLDSIIESLTERKLKTARFVNGQL